jgi:hypothetical protein
MMKREVLIIIIILKIQILTFLPLPFLSCLQYLCGYETGTWHVRGIKMSLQYVICRSWWSLNLTVIFVPNKTFSNSDIINIAVITNQTSFFNILNYINKSAVRDLLFDPQLTCVLMFLNLSTHSLFGYFYQWGYWAIMVTYIIYVVMNIMSTAQSSCVLSGALWSTYVCLFWKWYPHLRFLGEGTFQRAGFIL